MKLCLVSITILLGLSRNLEAFPRDVIWKQVYTPHFTITFPEQYATIAQHVARRAEILHKEITGLLNYSDELKTDIIITDHRDLFPQYDISRITPPVILLLGQPHPEPLTSSATIQDELSRQFVLMYTSALRHGMDGYFRSTLHSFFPDAGFSGWMEGGMAAWMESRLHGNTPFPMVDMVMRTEVLEDRLTTLEQRAVMGRRTWDQNFGSFVYGYSFLQHLSEQYGTERLVQLNYEQSKIVPFLEFDQDAFKEVYAKSLSALQQEWQESLRERYQKQLQALQAQPVTPTQPISTTGYWTNSPLFSPDGKYVYYIEDSGHHNPALMQFCLADGKKTRLTEGNFSGRLSISADGKRLFFSKTERYETFYIISDIYELNVTTQKITRLTKGEHAFDPAISADGRTLVYATIDNGSMNLLKMDLDSRERSFLITTSDSTQIRHPAFSSDGTKIVFQMLKPGRSYNIHVINSDGTRLRLISNDRFRNTAPIWGLNDEVIFFSSDRSGVPNIFAYSLKEQTLYQVTNVLTGVFDPAPSLSGKRLAVTYYSAQGMNIHLTDLRRDTWQAVSLERQDISSSEQRSRQTLQYPELPYNPLPYLPPKNSPYWGYDEHGLQIGGKFTGADLLGEHSYSLSVLYGLKSKRFALDGEYVNKQFYPIVRVFGYDKANKYTDLALNTQDEKESYVEQEQAIGVDIEVPLFRSHRTTFSLTGGYEYTKLDNLTSLAELRAPFPERGILSKLSAGIVVRSFNYHRYSISPESGVSVLAEYEKSDKRFGSDFNIDKVVGEVNVYLNSFFRHHVLVLKAAGGLSKGDTLSQGVFWLGGYDLFSKQKKKLWDELQFYLRGYEVNNFSGHRIALGTVEYRFPIWFPQMTMWDGWILWDHIRGLIFFEGGDTWNAGEDLDLKLSAGVEFETGFGIQHGRKPLSLSVGFAHGFDQDDGESQVYFRLKFQ